MSASYQCLILIATPKLAEKAAAMFLKYQLPIQYRLNGQGTASSEIMDTLGLGSVDKGILVSTVPQEFGSAMLRLLHSELRLDAAGSGIAFTIPLTGVNNLMLRMMNQANETAIERKKGDYAVTNNAYTLIAAVVDRGFGGEVMDAARPAGAGGGTIIHSRAITDEQATNFWGMSLQEEKEMVLILAEHENKVAIMQAISDACGMHSDAKGLVLSLPIDSVMGI